MKIYSKLVRPNKKHNDRLKQYPKGSILLLQVVCVDCSVTERELITIFKNKYIHRKDIGNEYFEGDYKDMMDVIFENIKLNLNKINIYNKYDSEIKEKPVKEKKEKPIKEKKEKPVKEIKEICDFELIPSFLKDFEITGDATHYILFSDIKSWLYKLNVEFTINKLFTMNKLLTEIQNYCKKNQFTIIKNDKKLIKNTIRIVWIGLKYKNEQIIEEQKNSIDENKIITTFLENFDITDNKNDFVLSSTIQSWIKDSNSNITMKKFGTIIRKHCSTKKYLNIIVGVKKKNNNKTFRAWIGIKHK